MRTRYLLPASLLLLSTALAGGCGSDAGTENQSGDAGADATADSGPGLPTDGGTTPADTGTTPADTGTTPADAGTDAAKAPRIVVSPPSGPATNEAGGSVIFTIHLDTAPSGVVAIPISVSKPGEASLSVETVFFNPTNYATPTIVTVKGKDDTVADGDQAFTVNIGPATGAGSGYEGLSAPAISLKNEDDDTAGFFVGNVQGQTSEAGGTATFTLRLRTQPTAAVTVPVVSENPAEGTTDVAQLVFDENNWNQEQTVTVTGADDFYDDGSVVYGIALGPAQSTDALYQGKSASKPQITNTDDDTAGLTVADLSGTHTSERAGTVTFTVKLAARPKGAVTVPLGVNDATEAQISPASLAFNTDTWDTPQTVTVTGKLDALVDGPQPFKATIGASTSAEAAFAGLQASVDLINDDDPLGNYVDFSINHVLSGGQSNSTANGGTRNDLNQGAPQFQFTPVNPTYTNLTFNTGVFTCASSGCKAHAAPVSFMAIREGDQFYNYGVETISSFMANTISAKALATYFPGTGFTKHDVLGSQHGRSGVNYACIRKGACGYDPQVNSNPPFEEALLQVDKAKALAQGLGRSYVVRGITFIHGEDDHYSYGQLYPLQKRAGGGTLATYTEALGELIADYNTDIKARTGQVQDIPLFVTQMHSWTSVVNSPIPATSSPIPVQQYRAHKTNPNVVVVTPGYMENYNDCLHYNGVGQRRLGEYMAKAYAKWVFEGKKWEPVGPKSITRNGAVVTVKYHVPKPPLVIDTNIITNPGNNGFRYLTGGSTQVASGTAQTIQSVAVTAPDTITITLAAVPAGGNERLEYANYLNFQGTGRPGCPGRTSGVRGNVRDSDNTPSLAGGNPDYPLYNWGAAFELPVPYQDP